MTISQTVSFGLQEARQLLPKVTRQDNKSSRGRTLIIAGSAEFPGAGILAARAALRSGSGYVLLAQHDPPFLSLEHPDFLMVDLDKHSLGEQHFDAAAIGPGCGVNEKTDRHLQSLFEMQVDRLVVDADALTVMARNTNLERRSTWILTPHEGEMSRLLNIPAEVIREDRAHWVREAQRLFGAIVLLKGHETLIASETELVKIQAGNSALAKSGTGDVLTGIIASFLSQGLAPMQAACLGAFAHGCTADLWVKGGRDPLSMMASDLIEFLPQTLFHIRES
ncbi:Bifunctional NAD(P)H-hydrate repair enzyme Nnr [compost metagenome]